MTTLHLCLLLAVIACLIGAGLGLVALLRPLRVLKMVGLSLTEGVGHSLSEVRATYGGLFFVSHAGVAMALAVSPKIGVSYSGAYRSTPPPNTTMAWLS